MDVAAQLFQRLFLGLVGQVCQHLHRQPLLRVQLFGCICQRPQLFGGRQPGGTSGDHHTKTTCQQGKDAAAEFQGCHSRFGKQLAAHNVLGNVLHPDGGSRRSHAKAADSSDAKGGRKGDAHRQQSAACAMAFFCADTDAFHRGRLRLCKDLPEPAGHPGGVGIRSTFAERLLCIPVGITSAPLPEGLCGLSDTVVGCMDSGFAHIPRPVTDVHAPALKAVGKGIGHGVAKGAQLVFQLLLYLSAFVIISVIVSRSYIKFSHPSAGAYRLMMARATRRPSTAALIMPPAYPAPSPQG